jgi:hypothetical protein
VQHPLSLSCWAAPDGKLKAASGALCAKLKLGRACASSQLLPAGTSSWLKGMEEARSRSMTGVSLWCEKGRWAAGAQGDKGGRTAQIRQAILQPRFTALPLCFYSAYPNLAKKLLLACQVTEVHLRSHAHVSTLRPTVTGAKGDLPSHLHGSARFSISMSKE